MQAPFFQKAFLSRYVLCGEHAVLRGGEALVYPLPHYRMRLRYAPYSGPHGGGRKSAGPAAETAAKNRHEGAHAADGSITAAHKKALWRSAAAKSDESALKSGKAAQSDKGRRAEESANTAPQRDSGRDSFVNPCFPQLIVTEPALEAEKKLPPPEADEEISGGRRANISGPSQTAFLSVVSAGLSRLNKNPEELKGRLFLENSIPLGAGLASSAAFAAGAAWLLHKAGFQLKTDIASFAAALESAFHGQSSGMDVHAVLRGRPLLFKKGAPLRERPLLDKRLRPLLFLSFSEGGGRAAAEREAAPVGPPAESARPAQQAVTCGELAADHVEPEDKLRAAAACGETAGGGFSSSSFRSTKQAVSQVNCLFKENPEKARALDDRMAEAVRLAKRLPSLKAKAAVFDQLKLSIDLAESCFRKWGLIPPALDDHIARLKKAGAAAAKPSGAGLSGAVISLWRRPPPPGALNGAPRRPLII